MPEVDLDFDLSSDETEALARQAYLQAMADGGRFHAARRAAREALVAYGRKVERESRAKEQGT